MFWNTYNDVKLSFQNYYLSAPLQHIRINCSSAQTEVVSGDPLLQLENTHSETEHLCIIEMHSDTGIEEHHHFKVFSYMTFVYNGRHGGSC